MDGELLIFDVGGVLRDSSKALNEGYRLGFFELGIEYEFKAIDTWHLRGLSKYNSGQECIKALLAFTYAERRDLAHVLEDANAEKIIDNLVERELFAEELVQADRIYARYKLFFNSPQAQPMVQLFPNAKEIIQELKDAGYELAAFSNASGMSLERDLKPIGPKNFSIILSEDDVMHKKPDSEGINTIMGRLSADGAKTYYIGDAVSDIIAARSANCKAVAVLWGMGTETHLRLSEPDLMFKDLAEVRDYFIKKRKA